MFFDPVSGFIWQIASRDLEGMTVVKSHKLQSEHQFSPQDCVALDVAYLDLNTFGDSALRREIIGLFRAQLDAVQKRLQLPMDEKSWTYLTHTLKGAAAAVGARQLAALADRWGCGPHPISIDGRKALGEDLKQALFHFNRMAETLNV
jgi:hypothetical protein